MSIRRKAGDIVTKRADAGFIGAGKPTGRVACHVCECEMGEA